MSIPWDSYRNRMTYLDWVTTLINLHNWNKNSRVSHEPMANRSAKPFNVIFNSGLPIEAKIFDCIGIGNVNGGRSLFQFGMFASNCTSVAVCRNIASTGSSYMNRLQMTFIYKHCKRKRNVNNTSFIIVEWNWWDLNRFTHMERRLWRMESWSVSLLAGSSQLVLITRTAFS